MKNLFIVLLWFPSTLATLFLFAGYYNHYAVTNKETTASRETMAASLSVMPYQLYASLPRVLGDHTVNTYSIKSKDIIPELVKKYLQKYNSPMIDTSDDLVMAARKYELDPLLLVAIAQCESNLGKKMPPDCHNPFGWGIHSQGTLCFESWEEGYQAVAKGLRDKYFDKGLENPDDIMHRYTPPALEKDGSWAKCVNHFMDTLNTLKGDTP